MERQKQNSLAILNTADVLTKGTRKIMHKMDLMEAEIHDLRAANEALSKRRRAKKTRLRKGGSLSILEAQELGDQMEVEVQIKEETRI